jgi:hypothetical protein
LAGIFGIFLKTKITINAKVVEVVKSFTSVYAMIFLQKILFWPQISSI